MIAEAAPKAKRIGVFGGAFDPPHNAHVALASAALEQFALDALHIIPTGQAWHKTRTLSAPRHRLAMARLAFEQLPRILVDERELQRTGPSFTIDTLQVLQAENPQAQLYLIIGADQFADFGKWHRWQDILQIAMICIADRAAGTSAKAEFDARSDKFAANSPRFLTLDLPMMPVSATRIRELIASGGVGAAEIVGLLPESVARYISLHQLYRSA